MFTLVLALTSCAAVQSGTNRARWCNEAFDNIIIKGGQVTDINERTKLYEQAQVIMSEQMPFLPIAHSVIYEVISNKVTGYTVDPLGLHHFDYVGIK